MTSNQQVSKDFLDRAKGPLTILTVASSDALNILRL